MSTEIFGPILPVMRISHADEAIKRINKREKPLCVYIFCNDEIRTKSIIGATRSGSVGVNETVLQVGVSGSFLGGVGDSGMGSYGFAKGFETFSHYRPVMYSNSFWAKLLSPLQPKVGAVEGRTKWWLNLYLRLTGGMPLRRWNGLAIQQH